MTIPLRTILGWAKSPVAKTIGYEILEKTGVAALGAMFRGSKKSTAQRSRAAAAVQTHRGTSKTAS